MEVTFAKMLAKLVVHKFESNGNFKSLQITIEDGDNGSSKARYSEWSEGKTQQKKRDSQKSRLVVKIVSGNEFDGFNLDSCAKQIDDQEIIFNTTSARLSFNDYNKTISNSGINNIEISSENPSYAFDGYSLCSEEKLAGALKTNQSLVFHQDATTRNATINMYGNSVSPLEYSLEKVKENNARIMENIHILNRTLNYTKKKEILDIVCPRTMRYPCNSCGKCFVYKTGLKRHYSMRHAITEIQPRWQVVWTCIECFQVWPRQDLASEHASQCCKTENIDYVREIKTSSLLQCEFCEKVFTSIPRLLRHSKIHTTASNYECNACESTFQSYKAAEQHWTLCPLLKMYYSFSLPKMLLCNACDRKFRNYEQLYNHRYKTSHFMTKTHCNSSVKSLGILVYQCEICAQWFSSISSLQVHRSQNHSGYENYDSDMQSKTDKNFTGYCNTYYESSENDNDLSQMESIDNQHYI